MDRHEWLKAQEWLAPLSAETLPTPAAVTAFAGAASVHVSPAEQQGRPDEFRGPLAPDAVHLSFAVSSPSEDPMQLRLRVDVSLPHSGAEDPAQPPLEQQYMRVAACLDGQVYGLFLSQASHLVLPQQLAARLPAAMQAQLSLHAGHGAQRQAAAAAAGAGVALRQAGGHSFLCLAPPSSLPFLTLVFPHACLNIYPLGWKAAAAHVSQEHDAAELARLAQLLSECWQQQRLLRMQAELQQPGSSCGPLRRGPAPDWQLMVCCWHDCTASLLSGVRGLASTSAAVAAVQLAATAGQVQELGQKAAKELPVECAALQAAKGWTAEAVAHAARCPGSHQALWQLECQLMHQQQQAETVAIARYLAATCSDEMLR